MYFDGTVLHVFQVLIYLFTYLLTPWSRVLLEKLTISQLLKEIPAFYGTWRFITTFTSVCHLFLSWGTSIQSMFHSTYWTSILILFFQLCLGLPSGLCQSYISFISWLCPAFSSQDMTRCLVLSAFTSSPVSLLALQKHPGFSL